MNFRDQWIDMVVLMGADMKQTEVQGIGANMCHAMGMQITLLNDNFIPNISKDVLDGSAEGLTDIILNLSQCGPLVRSEVLEQVKEIMYGMVNRSRN